MQIVGNVTKCGISKFLKLWMETKSIQNWNSKKKKKKKSVQHEVIIEDLSLFIGDKRKSSRCIREKLHKPM